MVPTCAPAENARPCAFFAKAGPISPKTKRQGQGTLVSRIRKKGWASPLHILVFSHVEGTTQSTWNDLHACRMGIELLGGRCWNTTTKPQSPNPIGLRLSAILP